MFLHISNLYHLVAFVLYFLMLYVFSRNPQGKVVRTVSTLIQLTVVLLCVDILIGFVVIEAVYGSNLSAGWISKSIFGFPILLIANFGLMWWVRRRPRKPSGPGTDTEI